jgi:predicted GTPase
VAIGTPIDLARLIDIDRPTVRVTYDLVLDEPEVLDEFVRGVIGG